MQQYRQNAVHVRRQTQSAPGPESTSGCYRQRFAACPEYGTLFHAAAWYQDCLPGDSLRRGGPAANRDSLRRSGVNVRA